MKAYIGSCGLDCETCEARIATIRHDDTLREKVAALWSTLNGAEITPEMINCVGCRIDGPKTPYCESLCPIRQCAVGKRIETCGSCAEKGTCEKLQPSPEITWKRRKTCGNTSISPFGNVRSSWKAPQHGFMKNGACPGKLITPAWRLI